MDVLLTFCERCGTGFDVAPPPLEPELPSRKNRARKLARAVVRVLTEDEESVASIERQRYEQELTSFGSLFTFDLVCRRYVCATCWNAAADRCRDCEPTPVLIRQPADNGAAELRTLVEAEARAAAEAQVAMAAQARAEAEAAIVAEAERLAVAELARAELEALARAEDEARVRAAAMEAATKAAAEVTARAAAAAEQRTAERASARQAEELRTADEARARAEAEERVAQAVRIAIATAKQAAGETLEAAAAVAAARPVVVPAATEASSDEAWEIVPPAETVELTTPELATASLVTTASAGDPALAAELAEATTIEHPSEPASEQPLSLWQAQRAAAAAVRAARPTADLGSILQARDLERPEPSSGGGLLDRRPPLRLADEPMAASLASERGQLPSSLSVGISSRACRNASCQLPLSSRAQFCRRCGTAQA